MSFTNAIVLCSRTNKSFPTADKIRLAFEGNLCYNQFRHLTGRVGISVLQRLPKPVSDRNENLAFATVSSRKRVRETKLSRYLSCYKILYVYNCRVSLLVERSLPKPQGRVRFPYPAPNNKAPHRGAFVISRGRKGIEQIKCNSPGDCCSRGLDRAKH